MTPEIFNILKILFEFLLRRSVTEALPRCSPFYKFIKLYNEESSLPASPPCAAEQPAMMSIIVVVRSLIMI